jgi:hypothetical protein
MWSDVERNDVEWTEGIYVKLNLSEVKFLGIKVPCTLR